MAISKVFRTVVGVALPCEEYFSKVEVPPKPEDWCDHMNPAEDDAKYCPECGSRQPSPTNRTQLNEGAWPDAALKALRADEKREDWEIPAKGLSRPKDIAYVYGNQPDALLNGMGVYVDSGVSPTHLILGFSIHFDSSENRARKSVAWDALEDIAEEVRVSVAELGFDPSEVSLHSFSHLSW